MVILDYWMSSARLAPFACRSNGDPRVALLLATTAGVSLPSSLVTGILNLVSNFIVTPTQTTVNGLLGAVSGIPDGLGLLATPLKINAAGLLANAAGAPISLSLLTASGTVGSKREGRLPPYAGRASPNTRAKIVPTCFR